MDALPATDFLSFCPSLVDILKYMTTRDYPNWRLVNRRIHRTIESNWTQLKPTAYYLTVKYNTDGNLRDHYVEISAYPYVHRLLAFVTEGTIIVCHSSAQQKNSFNLSEISQREYPSGSIEHQIIKKHIGDAESYVLYRTKSIEEGLQQLLTPLACHYHWNTVRLCDVMPESLLNVVGQVFSENRSKVTCLELQLFLGTAKLITTLGCHYVVILFSDAISLMSELYLTIRKNRMLKIIFPDYPRNHVIPALYVVLQTWQTGSFHMNSVSLEFTFDPYSNDLNSIATLLSTLKPLKESEKTGKRGKSRVMLLGREADSEIIELSHNSHPRKIILHENHCMYV